MSESGPTAGAGWWLAVDFGTTNTAAAMTNRGTSGTVGASGAPTVLEIEGSKYLPSVVYKDDRGELFTGKTAARQAMLFPERAERVPKRALVAGETVVLGGAVVPAVDLVAAVLGRVYTEAVRYQGGSAPSRIVLTHPARWGDPQLARLRDAAVKAGIADPDFVPEPVAAAWYYARPSAGAVVAVFDIGGGTLDTAVLRSDGFRYSVAGKPGGDQFLGGEDFDEALLGLVTSMAQTRDAALWTDVFETGRQARRDAAYLRDDVTMAKEALSDHFTFDLAVGDYPEAFHLTRREFDTLIGSYVASAVAEMTRSITAASVTAADLTAVYLAGGSSRIPLVASRLTAELGIQPQLRDDPKTVVAVGALLTDPWQARDFRSAGGRVLPLVRTMNWRDTARIAFSRDGKLLATGSYDIQLWRMPGAEPAARVKQPWNLSVAAYGLDFSPDGELLATGDKGRVWLFRVSTGEKLAMLSGPGYGVTFSPDSRLFVTGSGREDIAGYVWDTASGVILRGLRGGTGIATQFAFSNDGRLVFSNCGRGLIVWDVATGAVVRTLDPAVFLPGRLHEGGCVATFTGHELQLWDPGTGDYVRTLGGGTEFPVGPDWRTAFTPDWKTLVAWEGSWGSNRRIEIWSSESGERISELQPYSYGAVICAMSPDGSLLASTNATGTVHVWSL
jgi:actin-like ATPase involved in cell morphogenesis